MVQDSVGFMWIGTKNGLNRYDGVRFKVYNQRNSSLSSSDISVLKIDRKGRMWIGTIGGGLNLYDLRKDKFINYKNHFKKSTVQTGNNIYEITEDSDGKIWIGTENGLYLYNEKSNNFQLFCNKSSSNGINSIKSICQINSQLFLIGTLGGGLFTFDKVKNKFAKIILSSSSPLSVPEYINAISPYSSNQFLIGSNGNGLLLFDLQKKELSAFLNNTDFKNISIIRCIKNENNRKFWIGTDGEGLLYFNKDDKQTTKVGHFINDSRQKTSLSNNTVNTIFLDNKKNIWLGTAWKGIDVIEKESGDIHYFYSDANGYNPLPVLSVSKTGDEVWMGTDGHGLSVYNLKSKSSSYNTNGGSEFIQCILPNKTGNYWVGTFSEGLILLNPNKQKIKQYKRQVNVQNTLPYNDVRSIVELESGNLWIGTWGGGLSYFDVEKQVFKNFRHSDNPNSISSDDVLSVLKNEDGTLWIATFGGGINLFDPKTEKFKRFSVEKKNSNDDSNHVFCFIKDLQNNLWLGTKNGLYKFNTISNTFQRINIGNSFDSNTIVSMITDKKGFIWMGTKDGVYRYNSAKNIVNKLPEITREFHINSAFRDKEGILYFGGSDKVVSFNPDNLKFQNIYPKVLITDFRIFNKEANIGEKEILKNQIFFQKEIVLEHDQNVLTFDFSIQDYPFSYNREIVLKMVGFENEWRSIGTQNTTTFTNLSPGEYTLLIKVLSDDNMSPPTELKIKILPPLWKTWWAYLLYMAVLVSLSLLYHQYSLKWAEIKNKLELEKLHREQEEKLHRIRQQFFTDISHEIRTPLTLIVNPLENLLKNGNFDAKQQKQLSGIRYNTNRLLKLVNELLNFRRLETGKVTLKVTRNDIVSFVNEIYLSYLQQSISMDINYEFKSSDDEILVWFDKSQLEKAVHNLISNAFKFTPKGKTILVLIKKSDTYVSIRVSDEGKGIPEEEMPHIFKRFYRKLTKNDDTVGFGIGLSVAKDIVELHSGNIQVKSKHNKGSKFTINLLFGKEHFPSEQIIYDEENQEEVASYLTLSENETIHENSSNNEFAGSTILLIEDNKHLKEHLTEILSVDYIVFDAENGKEGIEKALDILPDVIISDVRMPVMDGITMCHKLKSDMRTSHIPVILLTARTLTSHKVEGYETGADAYLTKPFDEMVLKTRVKNLLNNRKLLRDRYSKEGIINPKEISLNSPDEKFLSTLVQIIEDNIGDENFSIDQLAKDMAMSHSNVYKKTKALTGMSVVQFVKDFRLKRAAQLLKENKFSIIDITYMVGYTDRRHFSEEFKKKYKKSPSMYMKDNLQ